VFWRGSTLLGIPVALTLLLHVGLAVAVWRNEPGWRICLLYGFVLVMDCLAVGAPDFGMECGIEIPVEIHFDPGFIAHFCAGVGAFPLAHFYARIQEFVPAASAESISW